MYTDIVREDNCLGKYVIVTDATADLGQSIVDEYDIRVIPMNFSFWGKEYTHYPDERELSLNEFYEGLDKGAEVSTSQITPQMYHDFLEPLLREGLDVLYICFTSGLSGTYNNSVIAFEELKEKYPERKMVTIDSLCASIGEGLLVYLASKMKMNGAEFDEVAEFVEKTKGNVCHWFMVKDLNQLKKGGRISPLAAALGTTLGIIPVISTDREGKLTVITKVHGLKKSLAYLADRVSKDAYSDFEYKDCLGTAFIAHGHCIEYAEMLKELVLATGMVSEVIIWQVGTVIGSHVGSGMCAVTFVGENYKDL